MNAPARRGPGKDPRIVTFRNALEQLLESLDATVRIDTPREADYFRHGGILQYVLRNLLAA